MPEQTIAVILGTDDVRYIKPGTTVSEVLEADSHPDIVGGMINQSLVGLDNRITVPCTLTPVRRHDRNGHNIVHRTCTHMMDAILAKHYPNLHFLIGQSLHEGYYYELLDWEG
ncbi:hypothetical protein IJT17_06380, partial [bacterium]|nr:hypothetical protein [bacterium]